VEEAQRRLGHGVESRLTQKQDILTRAAHRLERAAPAARLPRLRDRLAHLESRLGTGARARVAGGVQKLAGVETHLHAISPQAVLERGYSITADKEGKIVRSAAQVRRGDVITTRVADGEIQSTVGKPKQATLF
jgi:exodeoxyribonuclease VII large subunit